MQVVGDVSFKQKKDGQLEKKNVNLFLRSGTIQQGVGHQTFRSNKTMNNVTTVKDLPKGEYFCLKSQGEKQVPESKIWVKGEYDRTEKKYEIHRFDDINHTRFVKGSTPAFLDFIF